MTTMLNRHLAASTVLGLVVAAVASPAQGGVELRLTVDGNPTSTYSAASGGTASTGGAVTIGGVSFNGSAESNSPGSPTTSFLVGSTLRITINDNNAHTITVSVGDVNFTQPVPGGTFTSQLGGTVFTAFTGPDNLTFQSYIDPANGQNSMGSITPGSQTTFDEGSLSAVGSFALEDATTIAAGLTAPPGYSMTSNYTLVVAAGNQGASLNLTTSATLVGASAIPEPATIAMALTALPILGLVGYRRGRRKTVDS